MDSTDTLKPNPSLSLLITGTPTISLQPYPTSQSDYGFSGRRRTITIIVGAIAAFLLVLLLCLGEYLLRRDRRRRLSAKVHHMPVLSLDKPAESETRPIPSEVPRALSGYIVNQPLNLPVPGSAAAGRLPEVYNASRYATQLEDNGGSRRTHTVARRNVPATSLSHESGIVSSSASALSIPASQSPSSLSGPPTSVRNPELATAIEIVASYAQLSEMQRQALYTSLDAEAIASHPMQAPGENTGEKSGMTPPPYRPE